MPRPREDFLTLDTHTHTLSEMEKKPRADLQNVQMIAEQTRARKTQVVVVVVVVFDRGWSWGPTTTWWLRTNTGGKGGAGRSAIHTQLEENTQGFNYRKERNGVFKLLQRNFVQEGSKQAKPTFLRSFYEKKREKEGGEAEIDEI